MYICVSWATMIWVLVWSYKTMISGVFVLSYKLFVYHRLWCNWSYKNAPTQRYRQRVLTFYKDSWNWGITWHLDVRNHKSNWGSMSHTLYIVSYSPLVMTNIAIEHGDVPITKKWFSIVMLVYHRVILLNLFKWMYPRKLPLQPLNPMEILPYHLDEEQPQLMELGHTTFTPWIWIQYNALTATSLGFIGS